MSFLGLIFGTNIGWLISSVVLIAVGIAAALFVPWQPLKSAIIGSVAALFFAGFIANRATAAVNARWENLTAQAIQAAKDVDLSAATDAEARMVTFMREEQEKLARAEAESDRWEAALRARKDECALTDEDLKQLEEQR